MTNYETFDETFERFHDRLNEIDLIHGDLEGDLCDLLDFPAENNRNSNDNRKRQLGVRLIQLGVLLASGSTNVGKLLKSAADEVDFLEKWGDR